MKNFNTKVLDNGVGKGTWQGNIVNGEPDQGFFEFNITSLWHAITFDADITYQMYRLIPQLEFTGDFDEQYKSGKHAFSVEVTDWGDNPLENVEVVFEVLDENEKIDHCIYDIRKFFKLAADCNPNLIENLYVDDNEVLICNQWAKKVRDNRHLFLSAKAK